jgi:DNA-binding transcriptional MerR regulator
MEQELISKKELLELYGISYGALYRWKRKGLIPEDWFIKKSTVTGQETFFPRVLICERMELILRQKDDVSLEEMAKQFSEESRKRATLVIETSLGLITVELADIKSAVIDGGDGSRTDVTSYIIGGKKS